jgi:hypothetical protein
MSKGNLKLLILMVGIVCIALAAVIILRKPTGISTPNSTNNSYSRNGIIITTNLKSSKLNIYSRAIDQIIESKNYKSNLELNIGLADLNPNAYYVNKVETNVGVYSYTIERKDKKLVLQIAVTDQYKNDTKAINDLLYIHFLSLLQISTTYSEYDESNLEAIDLSRIDREYSKILTNISNDVRQTETILVNQE